MRTATRRPIERYAVIDRAIRRGDYPNACRIARELEVCARTIQRDIDHMRLFMKAPIEYVAERHGYVYSDPEFQLRCSDLTEGDLLALCLAERVLQQYRGTPYAGMLATAFGRMTRGLDARVTIDLSHMGGLQSFRTTAAVDVEPAVFEALLAAIRDRRRLELDYWSATSGRGSRRRVDPYHLASVDGQWYLIGYCHRRKDVRMFVPGRMREVTMLDERFESPEGFDLDAYLGGALDHGYALFSALCRVVPDLHGDKRIGVHPIRGRRLVPGVLGLMDGSRLRLRMPSEEVAAYLNVAGRELVLGDHRVRVGIPRTESLMPAPRLASRLVTYKHVLISENAKGIFSIHTLVPLPVVC